MVEVPPPPEDKYELNNTPISKSCKTKFGNRQQIWTLGLQKNKTWRTLPSAWTSVKKKRGEKKGSATISISSSPTAIFPSALSTIVSLHVL